MIYGNNKSQILLKNIIATENKSIFLHGPEGVGKFSFLKEYLESKDWEKVFIDSEDKFLKIETARKIISLINKKSEKRIIVVNDFHKFIPLTQNIFLKSLEEIDSKTLFIFISHQEEKILPTIKSRCLKIKFGLVSEEETKQVLKNNNFDDRDIDFVLKIYPYQPGKALRLLSSKQVSIWQSLLKDKKKDKILLRFEKIFDLKDKNLFDLREFLEIYLLLLRRQIIFNPYLWQDQKFRQHFKESLNLYFDSDYNLNFQIQLVNLLINNG